MEKKRVYERPALRKVRLEVKASVLATCHTSLTLTAQTVEGEACTITGCQYP